MKDTIQKKEKLNAPLSRFTFPDVYIHVMYVYICICIQNIYTAYPGTVNNLDFFFVFFLYVCKKVTLKLGTHIEFTTYITTVCFYYNYIFFYLLLLIDC